VTARVCRGMSAPLRWRGARPRRTCDDHVIILAQRADVPSCGSRMLMAYPSRRELPFDVAAADGGCSTGHWARGRLQCGEERRRACARGTADAWVRACCGHGGAWSTCDMRVRLELQCVRRWSVPPQSSPCEAHPFVVGHLQQAAGCTTNSVRRDAGGGIAVG